MTLRFTPSTAPDGSVPYYISLTAPEKVKSLTGKKLHRISYWNSDRSTDIPIAMWENRPGLVGASLQISEQDMEEASIVIRYEVPNTSSETGFRINLQALLKESLEESGEGKPDP